MRRLALLVVLAGCGSEMADEPPPVPAQATCQGKPTGLYKETWLEQSGDCGPQSQQIVNMSEWHPSVGGPLSSECSGSTVTNETGCTYTTDVTCYVERSEVDKELCRLYGCSGDPLVTLRSAFTWVPSLAGATGTVGVTFRGSYAGQEDCSGVYKVLMSKL